MRETEVRLIGWCEGGLGQQINGGGVCTTMSKKIGRSGEYWCIFRRLSVIWLLDHHPMLWWLIAW